MAEGAENSVNLNGTFNHKVDAKGRMSLPASFRKVLPNDLVVTIDPYGECLRVYVTQAFNAWVNKVFVDKFGKFDSSNKEQVRLKGKLKRRAEDVTIDSAGRILLPAGQREAVGITKDVVVTGNDGYFEIWDAQSLDRSDEDTDLSILFGK